MKRIVLLALGLLMMFCAGEAAVEAADNGNVADLEWRQVVNRALDTSVVVALDGDSIEANRWLEDYVVPQAWERYNLRVLRMPMTPEDFLARMLGEKKTGKTPGVIDLVWINGEEFKALDQDETLYGPFTHRLPNFTWYANQLLSAKDFGYPVRGMAAPLGMSQFVFEYDQDKVAPPTSFADLPAWVREHPGRFTYCRPPCVEGSAFLRLALFAVTGGAEQYRDGFDRELFDRNAPKLWAFLNDLEPYMWQSGTMYPRSQAALDVLFKRGDVLLNMSYSPLRAQGRILRGSYPGSVRTLVMAEGGLFRVHFMAVPFNAPNKAGALLLANFLLSPEAQLNKYDPANWGDLPALDLTSLDHHERAAFDAVDLGEATLPPQALAGAAVPEMTPEYVQALEEGWVENVLLK